MLSAQELGLIVVGFMLAGTIFAVVRIVRERRLSRDPSVQHPVCRRCGYQLDNVTSMACSECGAALGARHAIVPAWYHRVHMRRMRIWCAGAPGLLGLLLLITALTGVPGTPAVPGTPVQVYVFLSWPASSSQGDVMVHLRPGREAGHQPGNLLPGAVREVSVRGVRHLPGGIEEVFEQQVTVASEPGRPPLLPGDDGVVRDEAGVPVWGQWSGVAILSRDASGMEIAERLLPSEMCAQMVAVEAAEEMEQAGQGDACAALRAFIAEFLDNPLTDFTQSPLLPAGATGNRAEVTVGGIPATPMQPFFRRWMLSCAVVIYLVGAVLAGISARRVWSWPEVSREK